MRPEPRLPIKLACDRFRDAAPMNMGECVELFELAQDVDEAKALAGAYAEGIESEARLDPVAAHERTLANLRFGLSYMGRENLYPLYFPDEHSSPDDVREQD